ncbi:MAG: STAS domain-containing protein [Calditrichaeota bacterium]|nr:STAS domain-containing protein [Calditrichota bacterium]MCB9391359.1 STAS domain-containing protein [Calditrichota bacterium]
MFKPKLFTTLQNYSRDQFLKDLVAGIIVGIVALPLCIAFAIASGVSPERGLFAGVIGGFFISLLGGSRVQIGGPAGAFVVIVFGIIAEYGLDGLIVSTFLAGILLIVFGRFKLGTVIKFIPLPVVMGFTCGIALIIFISQIPDFLGLTLEGQTANFFEKLYFLARATGTINLPAAAIGLASVVVLMFWSRVSKSIPGSLVVLIGATAAAYFLKLPVETIGSRFGDIPSMLPMPQVPDLSFAEVRRLVPPAITIAVLVAIESLLSAVVADGMIGGKHRSNMELIAQGVANIGSAIFGGLPVTGAIARTATNVRSGGRTPVSGIVHAVMLLLLMLVFGGLAKLIPLAALAAILVAVAYNMFEWRSFVATLHGPKSDIAVLITTLSLTVILDLTIAIQVGMVMAVFLFMKRMSGATEVELITHEMQEPTPQEELDILDRSAIPKDVQVYEINGPFFFGAVYKFREAMITISKPPRVRIIRMRKVPVIDSTGMQALVDVFNVSKRRGTAVLISGLNKQPRDALEKAGLIAVFGEENLPESFDIAIERAKEILAVPPDKHKPKRHPEKS